MSTSVYPFSGDKEQVPVDTVTSIYKYFSKMLKVTQWQRKIFNLPKQQPLSLQLVYLILKTGLLLLLFSEAHQGCCSSSSQTWEEAAAVDVPRTILGSTCRLLSRSVHPSLVLRETCWQHNLRKKKKEERKKPTFHSSSVTLEPLRVSYLLLHVTSSRWFPRCWWPGHGTPGRRCRSSCSCTAVSSRAGGWSETYRSFPRGAETAPGRERPGMLSDLRWWTPPCSCLRKKWRCRFNSNLYSKVIKHRSKL